jgi:hypothetical protein
MKTLFLNKLNFLYSHQLKPVKVVMTPEAYRALKPHMEPYVPGKTGWGYLCGLEVGLSLRHDHDYFKFISLDGETLSWA